MLPEPNAPPAKVTREGDAFVLPSQAAGLDATMASLSTVSAKLAQVPFQDIGDNLNKLLLTANGTLGGSQSSGQAISRQGTVVGFSSRADGTQRAFSYFRGMMSDLGGDPSLLESAFAISGWQLPVGIESATAGLGAQGVWYFNGRALRLPSYLLNPPSGTANVQHVTGVNDLLQVTAALSSGQGEFGGFIGLVGAPGFGQPGIQANGFAAVSDSLGMHPQSVIASTASE